MPPERKGAMLEAVPIIHTTQSSLHPRLEGVVKKHLRHAYQRPPTPFMQETFAKIYESYRGYRIILDTGCGRGHSTRYLAERYPEHLVLGLDKSVHRLQHLPAASMPENARLLRVDLVDFWLLAQAHHWHFEQVYLLYPNPWPKA